MGNLFGAVALGGILGFIIGIAIGFIPTIIAFLKGGYNKGQILKAQIIIVCINIAMNVVGYLVAKLGIIATIFSVISTVWSLIALGLWIYMLIFAITGRELTLFSRFGIR